jgi:hypothetical protein
MKALPGFLYIRLRREDILEALEALETVRGIGAMDAIDGIPRPAPANLEKELDRGRFIKAGCIAGPVDRIIFI